MACRVPRHIPLAPPRPAADHPRRPRSPPLYLSLFRGLWRAPAPCLLGARACSHRRRRHRQPPKHLPPSPLCPWRRSRHLRRDPASHRWFRPAPVLAPLVPPRLIQPKQPQILPKLSSGSANMTTPSAAATTRSQSPRAAQHKATPRPAPVPAPQPATTVQRGAAMGLNTGSPLLIGNPAAAQPGMFPAGPAHGTFLLNQYIPGLGHSPILIQGTLGQTQSSLGQIQGVQLALRPPHATGLTLGPQTGPRPHGEHPGPPGTPTLVIPQNLGPRPNIFLAPPRMMSPPSFAIVPGQPLTLQQLQAMLPTQTTLAQPTLDLTFGPRINALDAPSLAAFESLASNAINISVERKSEYE
ncbi:hypothetical protein MRX96_036597 [Rhipicephalus microplus]